MRSEPQEHRVQTHQPSARPITAVLILDEQQRRFLAPLTPAEQTQLAALLTRLHGRPGPEGDARA